MVHHNDRLLVIGSTGSGKSEVLNYLASGLACQWVLVDTKHEFRIPDVEPVSDPADVDFGRRVIHYRDLTGDPDEFGELFDRCYRRHDMVVVVHELADLCAFNANNTPRAVNTYLSKGRARGLGLYAGSQRPVEIPTRARSESEHVFMVGERFLVERDHAATAEAMGQSKAELAALIDQTQDTLGTPDERGRTHAYLWFDRNRRSVVACPQLPPEHRNVIIVQRTLEPTVGGGVGDSVRP
jgi:energy-coupling factor transporter ATP-binding protein EcfA2